jgi:hypothetical protein
MTHRFSAAHRAREDLILDIRLRGEEKDTCRLRVANLKHRSDTEIMIMDTVTFDFSLLRYHSRKTKSW